jgi:four helix bundle protein
VNRESVKEKKKFKKSSEKKNEMRSHRKLDVWQKSVDFVVDVYETTKSFPSDERFGLISQLRRASSSIPANIAEGAARKSDKEFIHFLSTAQGSASEVDTHLFIALKLGYLSENNHNDLDAKLDDIGRMITGLANHLKRKVG